MLLRVRGPEGQTTLKLEPGATVAALKALLEEQTGVAAAYQEASAGCCDACWVLTWALGAHDLGAHERLVVQLSGAPPCCRQPPNDSCPFSQLDPCTLVDCSGPPACRTSRHALPPATLLFMCSCLAPTCTTNPCRCARGFRRARSPFHRAALPRSARWDFSRATP